MTDVPDHTRGLATILAHAGVKFFHHGCNDNCSHPDVPELYWWEGPDGSRVLTVFSWWYGSDLCPPPDWPHKTWLCMWMTYDNQGPPDTKAVEALFARAKQDLPGVRVRFGQMSDFADAILREKPDLPVVRGDTPDTWIHGIGSMPIETQLAHATRPRIAALESLDTLLGIWGVPTEPAAPDRARRLREHAVVRRAHLGAGRRPLCRLHLRRGVEEEAGRGRLPFPAGRIRPETGLRPQGRGAGRAGHRQRMAALAKAVDVSGRRVVVFNPLALDPRRRSRRALDRRASRR